ncbi:hypothetical protein [Poseidonibacter ostreae]|nr:hypothetical protein [Poseidonibacter ostreae]
MNIFFCDIYKDFDEKYSHFLIDGRHPNSLGMMKISDDLKPLLKKALNHD